MQKRITLPGILKSIVFFSLYLITANPVQAGYVPIVLTGFTQDVVANGSGSPSSSTTHDFDNAGYYLVASDFSYNGNTPTTGYLPNGGVVNSIATSGLTFQLASYTANNAIQISNGNSGTLTFATPQSAGAIFILCGSGSGDATFNATITFTDNTTQTFNNNYYCYDWFTSNSNAAIKGIGRVNSSGSPSGSSGSTPMLDQFELDLNSSNYSKQIASVTITHSTANSGYLNVMAISAETICSTPTTQPTNLTLNAAASTIQGNFTGTTPSSGYLVVRTNGTTALNATPVNNTTYNVGNTLGNGTVVYNGPATTFTDNALSSNTTYTYTVFSESSTPCVGTGSGIQFYTVNPLTASATTTPVHIYTWNQTASSSWAVATNWTPTRTVPDPSDLLVFNNGGSGDIVTNVPTQTVGRISVSNNTTVQLRTPNSTVLTIQSDNDPTTNELSIEAGSQILMDGTNSPLKMNFSGTGGTANIAGNLEMVNSSNTNQVDFTNCVATVTSTGQLAAGGANSGTPYPNSSATNLLINGTFNFKYTSTNGPAAPTASWNPGSTFLISGYTSATGGPNGGMNQTFYNFTYNCPNQTGNTNWSGTGPLTVTGTCSIVSTGTGTLQFAGNQGYTYSVNNFTQTGGTLDLQSSSTTNAAVLNISGTFNQNGGQIESSNSNSNPSVTINFNQASGVQNVNFSTVPLGPISYHISAPGGIALTGTGLVQSTGIFNINDKASVRVSVTAANPLSTALSVQYSNNNTTLIYDTTGNSTITSTILPASAPPLNLTVNVGSGNVVTLPFNATVGGTLALTSGDLSIGSNTLTIGTGTTSTTVGNITGTGNVRVITGGTLTRWFNPASLPTSAAAGNQGYFPLAYGYANRNAYVYFSGSSALANGGTISVSHTPTTGLASVTGITDGTYSITNRTNASWTLSTSNGLSLATSSTIGLKITGGYLLNVIGNVANLRLIHSSAPIPGIYVAGSGVSPIVSAERTGLVTSDFSTPFYIAANGNDIGTGSNGVYTAITTGNWSTGSNWDIGSAPGIGNVAVINPGVTTTVNNSTCKAKALTVLGTLNNSSSSNTLTIDSVLVNNGTVNISGGTLMLNGGVLNNGITNNSSFNLNSGTVTMGGGANNYNKPFVNNGALTVTSGTLNINGNLSIANNSIFTQKGGTINIDGNASGNIANSVPGGTALLSLSSSNLNLTGGTITIVDPHANTVTSTNSFEYAASANYNDSSAHTIRFGDGSSTDVGGSPQGFVIDPWKSSGRFAFGNLVINGDGSAANSNRFATILHGMGVLGDMTINANGEFRTNGQPLYLNGSLTVNTGGILTADNTLYFQKYASAIASPATGHQSITGGGTFRNSLATISANLGSVTVQDSNGVFLGTNLSYYGTLTLTPVNGVPSRIYMANSTTLSENSVGTSYSSNNASQANGWIVGTYQKHYNTGSIPSNWTYPIGDSTHYTPVTIAGSGSTATLTSGDLWIRTVDGNHPSISSSLLNPLKTIKRYYSVGSGVNVPIFTPGAVTATFNWVSSDVSAGVNSQNLIVALDSNNMWLYPSFSSATSTSIKATSLAPELTGDYQIAESCPVTTIVTQPITPQSGCTGGAPVTFSVSATGAGLTYQWLKNGLPISGATDSNYTINSPTVADAATYSVIVSSICAAPVTSAPGVLNIGAAPPIVTQPLSATVCAGGQVCFNVSATGAGLSYQWYSNNNAVGTNSPNFCINSAVVPDSGVIQVKISNSCNSTLSVPVHLTVNPLPIAQITAAGPTSFCAGSGVVLNATQGAGYNYQWTPGNSTSPAITAVATDNYSVTVTDANGCSSTSNTIAVNAGVLPTPALTITGSTTFCNGDSVKLSTPTTGSGLYYQWQLNGNNIGGAAATDSVYNAMAAGDYTLQITNSNNCVGLSNPVTVTVLPLPAANVSVTGGNTSICNGNSVDLVAPTGANLTYQWMMGGTAINGASNYTYSANASGDYTVQISDGVCSATSAPINVLVNALPVSTITPAGATIFCQGGSVSLQANAGTGLSYQWMRNGTNVGSNGNSATYIAMNSGNYTVKVSNAANCSAISNPVGVAVNPLPTPVVSATGQTLSTPSMYVTYQWYLNGQPISGSSATGATYFATADGLYSVEVTDANGCSAMSPQYNLYNVGVPQVSQGNDVISIYPNPASNVVHVAAPYAVDVTISGIDGRILIQQTNAHDINISNLANGVYTVKVMNKAGEQVGVEKLIKASN